MSNHARRPKRILAGMLAGALALSVSPILGFTGVASADHDTLPALADPIGDGNVCEDMPVEEDFTDVATTDPSYDEIVCLLQLGQTQGTGDGSTYEPAAPITRRQMALFIVRLADDANALETGDLQDLPAYDGEADFNDISDETAEIQAAIGRLNQAGIVEGVTEDQYVPGALVSRRQMAAFVVRLLEFLTGDTVTANGNYFHDDEGDSGEANLNVAAELGIFQGDGEGNVNPGGSLTRRQMANVLTRTSEHLFEEGLIERPFAEDDEAPSNQNFDVAGALEAREFGAANARTCAATVPAGTVVDLLLVPTEEVIRTGNVVTFVDADQNEIYGPPAATGGSIIAVNGAPVGAADQVNNVTSSGTVNVTVQGDFDDDLQLLVFADPVAPTGSDTLNLTNATPNNTTPKTPAELFGVGCRTIFVPAEAPLGNAVAVDSNTVNRDLDFLVDTGSGLTFYWDGNDTFQYQGVALTQEQFEGVLTSGTNVTADVLTITYNPDPAGVSVFNITTDEVVAPAAAPTATVINADAGATINDVRVVFTPSNLNGPATVFDIVADNIVNNGAIDLTDTVLGNNVACTPAPATGQCTLTFNNAPNGTYDILIRAENPPTTQMSAIVDSADITVPGAPDTTAPLAIDTIMTANGVTGLANTVDTGDVFKVVFNEAIGAPVAGDTIRATDNDGATDTVADIVNGTNATFALNAAAETVNGVSRPAGTVLTVTLTAAPTQVQAGLAAGLQIPATIIDQSGTADVGGVAWNPATAGQDVTIEGVGVDTQNNSLDTTGPTATSNDVVATNTQQTITFNEAINPATLTCADITVAGGVETCATVVLNGANTVATVTFSDPLEAGDDITLAANSVADPANNTGPPAALVETVA